MPVESFIRLRNRRFACLDFGGPGPVLLALHGHFGRGRIFAPLAAALAGRCRVVALDQRGNGLSDNGGDFTPDTYVADAAAYADAPDVFAKEARSFLDRMRAVPDILGCRATT